MTDLNALDRALLERLQAGVPLTPWPFGAVGQLLGLEEVEVLARVHRLKEANVIRQISAIFDTRRLGYTSTLVAFHVVGEALEDVASRISAHPGVSHNYARPHHYNLWFTLAVPPGTEIEREIHWLAQETGVADWLHLPVLRVFKIRTHFKLSAGSARPSRDTPRGAAAPEREFLLEDIPYVRALQEDLPLVSCPFAVQAEKWGLGEGALLDRARSLQAAGIMRRCSAVLRHRRVGYQANGMACWAVSEAHIEEVGRLAAGFAEVSHCYQRPAYPPRWPYSLFTMIHGQTKAEVEAVVEKIAGQTGIEQYEVLYSTREFKKERVRYFEVEEGI
jgi:DNA-binding Lrp family transcriptional regulator